MALSLAALVAYAIASHLLMVHAPTEPWAVAVLFGPLWLALSWAAWRQRHWLGLAACLAAGAVLVAVVAQGGVHDVQWMYVLQHGAIHLALAATFARTLLPGREALITGLAGRVHTRVTEAMHVYTRRLTAAWALYFVAMVGVSLVIFLTLPWATWSLFCNLLTPVFAVAFFALELGYRRWRHPGFERVTAARAWSAFQGRGSPP